VCGSYSPALQSSPSHVESVEVQRLLKFSATLPAPNRAGSVGTASVSFAIYNSPEGGELYWHETQNVAVDAQGRYSVLLGETTPGGLPADIFALNGHHWLGVQAAGQAQRRLLLMELPSPSKADPADPGVPIRKQAASTSSPSDRPLALVLLIMFLAGAALAGTEVAKWWKKRMELYRPPPLANLINYDVGPERRWRATQVLWFPLSRLQLLRGQSQPSGQSVDHDPPEDDPPKEDQPKDDQPKHEQAKDNQPKDDQPRKAA
jgi:hypothetical protein